MTSLVGLASCLPLLLQYVILLLSSLFNHSLFAFLYIGNIQMKYLCQVGLTTSAVIDLPSLPWCGHNRGVTTQFCNSLGTMDIMSFRGRTIDLTIRDMGSEFRYIFGKVLGTQDFLTLRLASYHCVLRLKLDLIMFKTYLLNSHTHQHASKHTTWHHHPKTHTYPSIKHKKPNYTYTTLAFI